APQADSMRLRTSGMPPPGSPATISALTDDPARSIPSSCAVSAIRKAYVGVQKTTLMELSMSIFSRAEVLIPPAGRLRYPIDAALSNAAQNPMNGPNENGNIQRSPRETPAAPSMYFQ